MIHCRGCSAKLDEARHFVFHDLAGPPSSFCALCTVALAAAALRDDHIDLARLERALQAEERKGDDTR